MVLHSPSGAAPLGQVVNAQSLQPTLCFFGGGQRRWRLLEDRPAGVARVLWPDAVQDKQVLYRLDRPALRQLLAWQDAVLARGLGVAAMLSHEAGVLLQPHQPPQLASQHRPQPSVPVAWAVAFDPNSLCDVALPQPRPAVADLSVFAHQRAEFVASVRDALRRIAAGEIYQVNLTTDALLPAAQPPALLPLCAQLAGAQTVPFGLAMNDQDFAVVSGSMERFLTVQDGIVWSRPIKGTAPRSSQPDSDAAAQRALLGSAKERAENLMIVDMMRNDLQRACLRGSVRVEALLQTEAYATVWHLESEIAGQLLQPELLQPLLEVALPPASVTGCPKLQALHVIAERERSQRGPYCGALGVAMPDGSSDWSVAIRTLVFADGLVRAQVGAGIVADSDPEREWQELLWKARAPLTALAGLAGGGRG